MKCGTHIDNESYYPEKIANAEIWLVN